MRSCDYHLNPTCGNGVINKIKITTIINNDYDTDTMWQFFNTSSSQC